MSDNVLSKESYQDMTGITIKDIQKAIALSTGQAKQFIEAGNGARIQSSNRTI